MAPLRIQRGLIAALALQVVSLPSALAAPAKGQQLPRPTVDYAADVDTQMDMSGSGQAMSIPGKVWSTKEKERREQTVMGMATTVILRFDKGVTWVLMPGNSYIEQPLEAPDAKSAGAGADAWMRSADLELTKEGTETIDGHATTKHRVQVTAQNEGQTAASDGYVWITKDNIPIKMEGSMTMTAPPGSGAPGAPAGGSHTVKFATRLTNVKLGKQDPALFELPAGYTKMDLGAMVPGAGAKAGASGSPGAITPEQTEQMKRMVEGVGKQIQSMTPEQRQQLEQQVKAMQEQFRKQGAGAPPAPQP